MTTLEAMRIARDHNVTPSAMIVLLVALDEAPTRASDIAERTGCSPANITGRLDLLERDGWIQRDRSTADRRSNWINPTERAFEIFNLCV